jgi:hypothetical protein
LQGWNCFVLQQLSNELQAELKEKAEAAGTSDGEFIRILFVTLPMHRFVQIIQ